MATKLFISYRRDATAGHAGRIRDWLEPEFGRDHLVMDVDTLPLGVDFVRRLSEEVAKCDVLLAVIGPDWINARDEHGNCRLDNPGDLVRVEIATALQRDIPVIPILLDGARFPKADQLPNDLEELTRRNGLDIRHASFSHDMDKLIRGLKRQSGRAGARPALVSPASPVPPGVIAVPAETPDRSEIRLAEALHVPGFSPEDRQDEAEAKQRAEEEERRRQAEAEARRQEELAQVRQILVDEARVEVSTFIARGKISNVYLADTEPASLQSRASMVSNSYPQIVTSSLTRSN
jgi:TIR domain